MSPQLFFIELTVRDWSASLAWYQEVLRLDVRIRFEADQFALLQAGEPEGVLLALKGGTPQPGSVLLTWTVKELDGWLEHLERCGVVLEGPVKTSPERYRRVRFRDPDGHALCLFAWEKR
jgi:predicted enzyme related to lactoylglutathione lyase